MAVPPTNPLHLYRALLRESHYLPDSQARTYLHEYVTHSYRNHLSRDPRRRKAIPLRRQTALLHRGRKILSVLRRANEGYIRPLQNILCLTYGRKGKRRRVLIEKLMEEDIPHDHIAVEALLDNQIYSRDWKPPLMVQALMRSQAKNSDHFDRTVWGSFRLRPTPDIPEKNTWGRPMPEKRVKNLMRTWYAKQVDRLLPPLPEAEFERLQALARGQIGPEDGPVPRRKRPLHSSTESSGVLLNEKLLLEAPPKSHTFEAYSQGRPHQLTRRLLQRLWVIIFQHVPAMQWDPVRKKWVVKWNVQYRVRPQLHEASSDQIEALFGSPLI
jgi:Complex 1 protein (LYR family)